MGPVPTGHDYYVILEVPQAADITGIRASYRRLAKVKHPDKNPGNPSATVEFQLVKVVPVFIIQFILVLTMELDNELA